jgi:hypothetical protein
VQFNFADSECASGTFRVSKVEEVLHISFPLYWKHGSDVTPISNYVSEFSKKLQVR